MDRSRLRKKTGLLDRAESALRKLEGTPFEEEARLALLSRRVDAHTGCVVTWFFLLVLVVGGLGAIRLRRGTTSAPPPAAGRATELSDLTDLDAAFDRVCTAHSHELGILLGARLAQLVHRQVPVRAIRQAPGDRAVRGVLRRRDRRAGPRARPG